MGSFAFRHGRFEDVTACPGCGRTPCAPECAVGAAEQLLRSDPLDGERRITCGSCGVVVVNRLLVKEDHLEGCDLHFRPTID